MAWSPKFKKCIRCKRTEVKYRARGLCNRCYDALRTPRIDGFEYRAYKVPKLSSAEKGYIAGLLDGEGCLGLYVYKGGNKKANMSVANTYRPVLAWACKKMECGSIRKYKNKRQWATKPCFQWTISSQPHIKEVLKTLLPFLQIKKDKATSIINFVNNHPDKRIKRI